MGCEAPMGGSLSHCSTCLLPCHLLQLSRCPPHSRPFRSHVCSRPLKEASVTALGGAHAIRLAPQVHSPFGHALSIASVSHMEVRITMHGYDTYALAFVYQKSVRAALSRLCPMCFHISSRNVLHHLSSGLTHASAHEQGVVRGDAPGGRDWPLWTC